MLLSKETLLIQVLIFSNQALNYPSYTQM